MFVKCFEKTNGPERRYTKALIIIIVISSHTVIHTHIRMSTLTCIPLCGYMADLLCIMCTMCENHCKHFLRPGSINTICILFYSTPVHEH